MISIKMKILELAQDYEKLDYWFWETPKQTKLRKEIEVLRGRLPQSITGGRPPRQTVRGLHATESCDMVCSSTIGASERV